MESKDDRTSARLNSAGFPQLTSLITAKRASIELDHSYDRFGEGTLKPYSPVHFTDIAAGALFAGVYVVAAGKGEGKSLFGTTMALHIAESLVREEMEDEEKKKQPIVWVRDSRITPLADKAYGKIASFNTNEPGTQPVSVNELDAKLIEIRSPIIFIDSFNDTLDELVAYAGDEVPRKGGWFPVQIRVLKHIDTWARISCKCVLITINTDIFPIDGFAGRTEGEILVHAGTPKVDMATRPWGRRAKTIDLRGPFEAELLRRGIADLSQGAEDRPQLNYRMDRF
jgi:hypothetical protein